MADQERRKCFVIGPIGEPDTPVRDKADLLLNLIIRPALEAAPHSFDVVRADKFLEPGLITVQSINAALESDLIVADLTGWNANAFYELALAHAGERPVISMIEDGERLPFDVQDSRTIRYRVDKISFIEAAKEELDKQAQAVMAKDHKVSNPVTSARGQGNLARSSDPKDQLIADLINRVKSLDGKVSRIEAAAEVTSNTAFGFGSSSAFLRDKIVQRGLAGNLIGPHFMPVDTIISDALAARGAPSLYGLLGENFSRGDESEAQVAPAERSADPSKPDHGDDEEKKP